MVFAVGTVLNARAVETLQHVITIQTAYQATRLIADMLQTVAIAKTTVWQAKIVKALVVDRSQKTIVAYVVATNPHVQGAWTQKHATLMHKQQYHLRVHASSLQAMLSIAKATACWK